MSLYVDMCLPVCVCVHITVKFIICIVKHICIYTDLSCAAITSTKQAAN